MMLVDRFRESRDGCFLLFPFFMIGEANYLLALDVEYKSARLTLMSLFTKLLN